MAYIVVLNPRVLADAADVTGRRLDIAQVASSTAHRFHRLVDAGFVRRDTDAASSPVPVGLGVGGRLVGWPTLVYVVDLLVTVALVTRKVRAAILMSIVGTTIFAVVLNAIGIEWVQQLTGVNERARRRLCRSAAKASAFKASGGRRAQRPEPQ